MKRLFTAVTAWVASFLAIGVPSYLTMRIVRWLFRADYLAPEHEAAFVYGVAVAVIFATTPILPRRIARPFRLEQGSPARGEADAGSPHATD